MPANTDEREKRLEVLTRILGTGEVASQDELVAQLRALEFTVTQSSVSRDLQRLGAYKRGGRYHLPSQDGRTQEDVPDWAAWVRGWRAAGPHMLVVRTRTGQASAAALWIDRSGWSEVVGTVAGDDTIFIAVPGQRQREKLEERLRAQTGLAE